MNTRIVFLALTSFAIVCHASTHAQQTVISASGQEAATFNKAKMDSFFTVLEANNKAMGSIALMQGGKIVYTRAVGGKAIEGEALQKSDEMTKYRIGSITKMFTAVLIFQLIESGKLKLETKLSKYYPTIPNADKITISNLLNHQSGIHSVTDGEEYLKWNTVAKTKKELLDMMVKSGPDFEPGSKSNYSNSNYILLGYIAEDITKQPYSRIIKERITDKAGLKSTYVGGAINTAKNESKSFIFKAIWKPEAETDMSIPGGAGALVATPSDLTRFADALFHHKILSKESLAKMMEINKGYGMGMFQLPFYDKKAYGHTGGIDGFSSVLCYFPGDDVSIAYCSNGEAYPVNSVLIGALSIYFKKPYTIPTFSNYKVPEALMDKYAGSYAAANFPMKIKVFKEDGALMAQATGQPSFPLEAVEMHKFKFDPARLTMTFDPEKNQMTLLQGGMNVLFTKE